MFKEILLTGILISMVFCSWSPIAGQESKEKFPSIGISNGIIKVSLYLPDPEKGYYRGTRFDWSGIISQVEYKGHTYFGEWKATHDPGVHDDIVGPVEEFRTGSFDVPGALGYKEAKPGEPFVKIGVGLLEKVEEPDYRFSYAYKIINPGKWKITNGKDWIEFKQEFKPKNGWAYLYTKRISIAKGHPEFVLAHSLKNIGSKGIETSQYNHNFFVIDGEPIGTGYLIRFPFAVKLKRDVKGNIEVKENEMIFNRNLLEGESLFTELEGFGKDAKDHEIIIENKKTGAGVRIKGDRPIAHMNFWTIKTTVCPEPFVNLNLAVGEKKDWKTSYTFYIIKE